MVSRQWPLHVVEWWGGRGSGDDVNKIIRYLPKETWNYEESYTRFLFNRDKDLEIKSSTESVDDLQRELIDLNLAVHLSFKDFEHRVMVQISAQTYFLSALWKEGM